MLQILDEPQNPPKRVRIPFGWRQGSHAGFEAAKHDVEFRQPPGFDHHARSATLQCRRLVFRAIVKVSVTDMSSSSTKRLRLRPRLPNGTNKASRR
jgi:hypothetical protein